MSATSGSSTLKLNENVESANTATNATSARRELPMKRSESAAPPSTVASRVAVRVQQARACRARAGSRRSRGRLAALSPNATPGPANATTKPPIAGPRTRAVVPRLDISATAFGRSFEPTIWKTSACRAGPSSAATTPPMTDERVDLPDRDPAAERQHRERRARARPRAPRRRSSSAARRSGRSPSRRRGRARVVGSSIASASTPTATAESVSCEQQPRGRDLLHPVAGERHRLAPEVEAEVAVLADARERARARRARARSRLLLRGPRPTPCAHERCHRR